MGNIVKLSVIISTTTGSILFKKFMIRNIFNCISIHNGGGIVYLSMMHSQLDKKDNLILLDFRAKNNLKPFLCAKVRYYKKSLWRNLLVFKARLKYSIIFKSYLKKSNKKEFLEEYYLNGIPPFFRFSTGNNKVYVLFQNRNLFSFLNYFNNNLFFRYKFIIYHLIHSIIINLFLKNTDNIIVQTNTMKRILASAKPKNNILIKDSIWKNIKLEFYKECINQLKNKNDYSYINKLKRISESNQLFFYPASLEPHKNHKILFKSFNKISELNYKKIKLIVTLDAKQLPFKNRNYKNIIFLGNQSTEAINKIYNIVNFLIFPSLNESLGLPLIEANLYKLPIIASNLDYVYDVCEPSLTFDPYSEEDIFNKILESLN